MVTRLKDINSFILNSYIDEINKFVGEEIVSPTNEELTSTCNSDVFEFFRKLATKITEVKKIKLVALETVALERGINNDETSR